MGTSVLIVDDDEHGREALATLLRHRGATVTAVASGEEAMTFAESFIPDVVIVDVLLPGMRGLEVCRTFKGHGAFTIGITGSVDAHADAAGVRDTAFLKPIDLRRLIDLLKLRSTDSMRAVGDTANGPTP